ncbi:MurR/RpiR family transcriptional regulator [Virgibacillus pantothenticus]|uniref:RpiR family transcriptional regulator n=1 Tax=Virgibacillus pantothenticus TaxID=1473 RepID=A0A0L0QR77_VIRPA|nr:MurR/RpiR family transcriptional regulator [Virgibacillus pantothenticus]KNE21130.1 RpiR family transcriptional regulator [Virgibacillus pantothenticus]MED3738611.1 MurR/RpiR family transcriptional regulator [Virgibacillus pantothenticus]QTY16456.1 MurR/RpiR family transcriptional regulator [Virgibacillus pantothenticus]SIT06940.1 transcriptional regulator, RpiR family [Virgibacillus pantothenticus]
MKLESLINKNYDKLNKNDLHVLQYILSHRETCYDLSIVELANACYASRSSIHRLTKKLGFSGYSEFKVFLKWEGEAQHETNNLMEAFQSDIAQTLKNIESVDFENINQLLFRADRIYIHGTGTAQLMCAKDCQRMFSIIETFIILIHDQVEFEAMYRGMKDTDVVIIISLSGDTPTLIPNIKQLNAKGIDVITITNLKNNKLAQMSPNNIYATTTPGSTKDGTEITSFVPFYIVIETMYRKYIEYCEQQKN